MIKLSVHLAFVIVAHLSCISQTIELTQTIDNPEMLPGDEFGFSMAASNTNLVIGAPHKDLILNDSLIRNCGTIYCYFKSESSWELQQIIRPPDLRKSMSFGYNIELTDEFLIATYVLGKKGGKVISKSKEKRSVCIYKKNEKGLFEFFQKIDNPIPDIQTNFAKSISIDHDILVIGCTEMTNGNKYQGSTSYGYCFVYRLFEGNWKLVQTISALKEAINGRIGMNVVLNDSILSLESREGPRNSLGNVYSESGAVYIYKLSKNGVFEKLQRLAPKNPKMQMEFGKSMFIHQDLLVVGYKSESPTSIKKDDNVKGKAEVYKYDKTRNQFIYSQTLQPEDSNLYNWYANSFHINSKLLAVGAIGQERIEGKIEDYVGAVYLYEKNNSSDYLFKQKIISPKPKNWSKFGFSVLIENQELIVGSRQEDVLTKNDETINDVGRVFVFGLK